MAVTAVGTFVVTVAAQHACVIAQPSGDVPRLPEGRPTILHASVVPSTTAVLTHWPSVFIVPVELVDPTLPFYYAAFVDYNPLTGVGLVGQVNNSVFDPSNTTGRVRTKDIAIAPPLDLDRCHVIEVIVALRLKSTTDSKNAHTPDEPGGDLVTWFYNPNGDVGGCPSLDAGIDASPDGTAE
jgi:hypothetical protein